MTESALVTFEEKVIPPSWPILGRLSRRHRESYVYPNGSVLVIAGIDKASKIMSTEYDMILAFEARELTEGDWESLFSRLRHGVMPYQQAIADTNPDAPSHWLNRRAENGGMTRLRSRHEDNPAVTADYIQRPERLTGVRYQRLRKGLWTGAEGMVYETWDPAVHLIDRYDVPISWRRIRSIDLGYTNPLVCQWWAIDDDGRMILYREIYLTKRLVQDHARQILELTGSEIIEATICDHDAEDRATLEREGIQTIGAVKAVSPGIGAVTDRLRIAGDGKPRLMIMRGSLVERDRRLVDQNAPWCIAQEFNCYIWSAGRDGQARGETPLKVNDHAMDAMRYAVAYVDGLGARPLTVSVFETKGDRPDELGWN